MNATRIRTFWFALLLRTFPKTFRSDNQAELLEILGERESWSSLELVRESTALVHQGMAVSFRQSSNAPALEQLIRGAAVWFGLLLGAGPMARLVWSTPARGPQLVGVYAAATVAGLTFAVAMFRRSAIVGFLVAGLTILIGAQSTSVGRWSVADAFLYEVRWFLPALLVIALRDRDALQLRSLPGLGLGIVLGCLAVAHLDEGSYGYRFQTLTADWRLWAIALVVCALLTVGAPRVLSRFGLPAAHLLILSAGNGRPLVTIVICAALLILAWNAWRLSPPVERRRTLV